jgi:hypothetical protein
LPRDGEYDLEPPQSTLHYAESDDDEGLQVGS